jgi:hypothetical protein
MLTVAEHRNSKSCEGYAYLSAGGYGAGRRNALPVSFKEQSMETRICKDCQDKLPLTAEHFRPHSHGFRRYCKNCSKVRLIVAQERKGKVK